MEKHVGSKALCVEQSITARKKLVRAVGRTASMKTARLRSAVLTAAFSSPKDLLFCKSCVRMFGVFVHGRNL